MDKRSVQNKVYLCTLEKVQTIFYYSLIKTNNK